MSGKWEVRRALRYGSESMGFVETEIVAKNRAYTDIEAHGDVGRIEMVDHEMHIVYYTVYPELT